MNLLVYMVMVGAIALCWLVKRLWLEPCVIVPAKLRLHGFRVLPYRAPFGDLPLIKRLKDEAASFCLSSPSSHDIAPLVLPFHSKIAPQTGSPVVFWLGTQPTVLVTDPEDVRRILSTDFNHYRRSHMTSKFLCRLLGGGLLISEGKDWQNQRSILRHAFFADKLKSMVVRMSASAIGMAQAWAETVKSSGGLAELEVAHDIKNTTADIIARTSFGSSYVKGKSIFEKQVLLLQLMLKNMVAITTFPGYRYIPTPSNQACRELERSIDKDMREIVDERRGAGLKNGQEFPYGNDLLGLVLMSEEQIDSKKVRLTPQQVVDECKTFFFAGHETTAHLLAWTMVLLGHYREWQERARTEVFEVCGRSEPEADHLSRLKILGMILNESLRLYPPLPELGPRVMAPQGEKLKLGSLDWPEGLSFSIPLLLLHRDKGLWGDNADQFDPERFVDGTTKACRHPCGFLPFSFGPRSCIGQSFAIMEAKLVMTTILQRFKFQLSPHYKHSPEVAITMRPRFGVPVILELA